MTSVCVTEQSLCDLFGDTNGKGTRSMSFFESVEPIRYEGPDSDNPLAFRWYQPDRVVGGRTMAEQLRFGVCYWHSFAWDGFDIFGAGTLDRPWHPNNSPDLDPMDAARMKMDAIGRDVL